MVPDFPDMFEFTDFVNATPGQNDVSAVQDPMGSYPPSFPEVGEFGFGVHEPHVDNYCSNLADPQWYLAEDIFLRPPSPRIPFNTSSPLLSPPFETPEQSRSPSLPPHPSHQLPLTGSSPSSDSPSPELPEAGPSVSQLPAKAPPISLPTSQEPVWQPASGEITNFYFCPFTKDNKICGVVSWGCSGNKAIERHMKAKHFKLGVDAMIWKCPNPKCKGKGRSFKRKDTLRVHRKKSCNPMHLQRDPSFVPLPDIQEGNDTEVKRWMAAGDDQRKSIRKMLRAGTPWSADLLQPIYLIPHSYPLP